MRRALLNEEETSARLASPLPEAPPKSASRKTRLLKGGYIALAAIGIVGFLIPALSGIPLSEMSLNAALKAGNLSVATSAFVALPAEDIRTKEYYVVLFPRLLEAGEYDRAAQIMRHTNAQGADMFTFPILPFNARSPQPLTVGAVGKHMAMHLGLNKSMEVIARGPTLTAMRASLLPSVFLAASSDDLPALEKLALSLQEQEQFGAVSTILYAHTRANDWDAAWKWTSKVPAQQQRAAEDYVLSRIAEKDTKEAIRRLEAWRGLPDYLSRVSVVFTSVAGSRPKQALSLLPLIPPGKLQDQAIGILLKNQRWVQWPLSKAEEIAELLDKQRDPAIRAWTLAHSLKPTQYRATRITTEDFILKVQVPRFNKLARQYPQLQPLCDEFLLEKLVGSPKPLQESYLAQLSGPGKQKWDAWVKNPTTPLKLKLLERVTNAVSSLEKPADFDKLTGIRD